MLHIIQQEPVTQPQTAYGHTHHDINHWLENVIFEVLCWAFLPVTNLTVKQRDAEYSQGSNLSQPVYLNYIWIKYH